MPNDSPIVLVPLSAPFPSPTPVSADEADPQEHRVERQGDRDLAFSGWLIGYAEDETDPDGFGTVRGVTVSIYATESDSLVLHTCRWEEREDSERTSTCEVADFSEFTIQNTADAALEWLKEDAGGKLGPTSKAAWEQACDNWSKLADEEVERI